MKKPETDVEKNPKLNNRSLSELQDIKKNLERKEEFSRSKTNKKGETKKKVWSSNHTQSIYYRHVCDAIEAKKVA